MEMSSKKTKSANLCCDVSVKQVNSSLPRSRSTYSDIAQATPKPSAVEVPLPNSSMMMREFCVAVYDGFCQT